MKFDISTAVWGKIIAQVKRCWDLENPLVTDEAWKNYYDLQALFDQSLDEDGFNMFDDLVIRYNPKKLT
jgi:hypothetical protein